MTNDFYLESPSHWLAIVIERPHVGVVRFRLLGDSQVYTGRARWTGLGWLVTTEK
jgi:hypothetical protein